MASGKHILKWSGIALAILAGLLAFLALLLANLDWNRAKPWLNRRIGDALGRPFAINGDLSVEWRAAPDSSGGWRRWVPWPHVTAQDIALANPEWVEAAPNMIKIRRLAFSVAPLPLLRKLAVIRDLRIDAPRIHLQRDADGRNNWTFKQDDGQAPRWDYELDRLIVSKGAVRFIDGRRKADIHAAVDTLGDTEKGAYGIVWSLSGSLDRDNVSGEGRAGKILSLQQDGTRYPVTADLRVGKTAIEVEGTLTNPRALAALDLRLKISGVSLGHLYHVTGIVLPETPPYSTSGRLTGVLNARGGDWRYERFRGKVGSSDIAGTLEFQAREPRPLLKGEVVSNLLKFEDLAPLIGADSNASKIRRGQAPVQPREKALPVEAFKTERWKSIDADVRFSGKRIVRKKELPIDNLVAHVRLQDGMLTLAPLNFGVAGGKLSSRITLDGRDAERLKAELKLSARHFKLRQLLPTLPEMHASLGEINGDAALTATGNSVAALLGSANGEMKTLINQGTVSKLMLEAMGLNIGNLVITKLFGDRQVPLNCLASDFKVSNGVMNVRTFVMDTDEAALYIDGKVDLAQEKLDLTLRPDTKSPRVVTLRSPIHVGGSFKKPAVDVDKGTLAAKAGAAVALGIAAPVAAALLPLVNLGDPTDNPCGPLLAQASKKPKAPPPGTSTGR
ncbi:MAG TPA: AsmA family protein [Paucimonas sp.]|nr:AsmA family protein [Paucimonas sp.]